MTKPVSWLELIKRLRRFGFTGPEWGGKHPFMSKGTLRLHIPRDHGRDISDPLLRMILRQAKISPKDWQRLT